MNKVAIVTGSGRRLGRQIAIALGENGYNVVVNYNQSLMRAKETVKLIEGFGGSAISIKADVSKRKDVHKMINATVREFGHIDVLVNNAAIFIHSPLKETSEKVWNTTIDINLKGTFLCSQAVALHMLKKKSGRIINIASLGGIQPWKEHIPYSVSKAGVIMLTKILAKALAPNIYVNAIAPGTIIIDDEETANTTHMSVKKIPLKKYGKPRDITDMVLYLATTSQYTTGQIFSVDGGRSI